MLPLRGHQQENFDELSALVGEGREWFVYALKDPRNGDVRYVGWTVDLKRRLYLHVWHSDKEKEKNSWKARWIRSVIADGFHPEITVLESGIGTGWKQAEPKWIAHFRALGSNLTNLTDGGDGTPGAVRSEETRRRISESGKGTGKWKKGVAAAAEVNRGRKYPREQVEKSAATRRGKKLSEQARINMAAAARRRPPVSDETKAKLSAAQKRREIPASHGEKTRENNLKRWAAARAALAPGQQPPWRGMKRTPEQCARIKFGRYGK
jgi:GIY-YIG catalytic domain/NUMOD3 motif